jgi:hypothetical protein
MLKLQGNNLPPPQLNIYKIQPCGEEKKLENKLELMFDGNDDEGRR